MQKKKIINRTNKIRLSQDPNVWKFNFQTFADYDTVKNMQKPKFANNELYHIYNRGVEKRTIFLNQTDYLRFVHDLFEFNDDKPTPSSNIRFSLRQPSMVNSNHLQQCLEVQLPNIARKLLVEVLVFCLMPNHYHLLLRQRIDGGIVKFMQKLGTGYTNYFNQKCKRVGPLFQGRFKAVLINRDSHFIHIPYYIHANPLELIMPKWKEREIENYKKAARFLENYRWSSFLDYIGKKNFPSVTQRGFLLKLLGGPGEYEKDFIKWLKKINIEAIKDATWD